MKTAFRQTKSLDALSREAEEAQYKLRRVLGPVDLTLLGIGAIIGAGIFATIGTAAAGDAVRPGAGPALMLSFVITAFVCGFAALCYAEFASMVPIAGSAYTYSYATLGELAAWIIGWDLVIEYAVGNIAVAISWANYFKTLLEGFGIYVPDWLSVDYRTAAKMVDANGVNLVYPHAPHLFGVPIVFNCLAVGIVAVITVVLISGIRESARFNAVMVGIKLLVLTFFIVVGAMWVKPANWTPFSPNGWSGISAGAAIVFFAYIGFDAVSTAAEETREPQRNMPIGILASLVACTVLYVVVSGVFTGLIPYGALRGKLATEQAEPLTLALQYASPQLGWAVGIVAFGSVVAHTAVLLVFQLGQPRILFAMARDGLLPGAFGKVHPRYRTPYFSTIATGLFVGGFAAIASLDEMVDLTNIGTLFAFIMVCLGIIVLRRREPERPRPFRVPGGWRWAVPLCGALVMAAMLLHWALVPTLVVVGLSAFVLAKARDIVIPLFGVVSCAYLIIYLPPTSWLRFAAWLNIGLVMYACYGANHSRLTGRAVSGGEIAHDARTALDGALLGVVGAVVLFVTRGLDLWHGAYAMNEHLEGMRRFYAAFAPLRTPGSWLEVSWFLLIPLGLLGGVLCPVLYTRASRALREARLSSRSGNGARDALRAIAILIGLDGFVVAYVVVVLLRNL